MNSCETFQNLIIWPAAYFLLGATAGLLGILYYQRGIGHLVSEKLDTQESQLIRKKEKAKESNE